jgi:hypothetical protein
MPSYPPRGQNASKTQPALRARDVNRHIACIVCLLDAIVASIIG